MLYGTAQPGFNVSPNQGLNLTSLVPGEAITLFTSADPGGLNRTSVAFARGYSPSAMDGGISFDASGMPSDMVIDIQVANQDIDGSYAQAGQISADSNGCGNYTDAGRSAFYRAKVTTYTTGAMPLLIAQR